MVKFKLHRIKEIVEEKGLSIRELGKMAGLSNSAISEMIRRNAANVINVQKIASALNIDLSELVEL